MVPHEPLVDLEEAVLLQLLERDRLNLAEVHVQRVDVGERVHLALNHLRVAQGERQLERVLATRRVDLRRINRLLRVVAHLMEGAQGVHVVDVLEHRHQVDRFQADASHE